jgi:hypothetical protein
LGSALDPGNMRFPPDQNQIPADFESSMASTIENALLRLLQQDNINGFEIDTNSSDARDRRRLLIAIAQGVVRHLVDNADAFQVMGTDSSGGQISVSLTINHSKTLLDNI